MRISDWSSDVCSSDLCAAERSGGRFVGDDGFDQRAAPPWCIAKRNAALRIDVAALDGSPGDEFVFAFFRNFCFNPDGLAARSGNGPDRPAITGFLHLFDVFHESGRSEEHTSELQSLMRI